MYDPEDCEDGGLTAPLLQRVRVAFLKYMDATGHLASLERAGCRYRETLSALEDDLPPFICTMPLDMLRIADLCGETCSMVLERPLLAQALFREVVHCCLVTLCSLPTLGLHQVHVVLRVDSLPGEAGLRTDNTKDLDPQTRRLLLLQHVVVALTPTAKYTRSAVFRCPNAECGGAAGMRVWDARVATLRRCRLCGGVLEEAPRGRDAGEHVFALTVRPGALRASKEATVGYPVLVWLADDLARSDALRLGGRCDLVVLTGSPMEVWGLRPWQGGALRRVAQGMRSAPLPPSVQAVLVQASAESESPWAFAVSLAAQLDGGCYPAHAFLHLKLGILLSLASQGLDHPPVPLFVVGSDPAGPALLYRCMRLADRGLTVTSAANFARMTAQPALPTRQAAPGPSPSAKGSAWLCASPLVLAQGGVCLLGCWDKWHRTAAAAGVAAALESGKATLESRDLTGMQLPEAGPSVPLQSAVWTHWSPGSSRKPSELLTLRTLLNTLGAPVLSDIDPDEMPGTCAYLLRKAQGGVPVANVLEKDMAEFLTLVNAQPVALTDDATRLIQDYFVASRRVRPNCLPITAVGTIAAMAEALARVSLRMEATWADVVLVVWMYEETIAALFGPCCASPLPEVCRAPLQADQLVQQMDCRLNSVKVWLENFTKSVLLSSLRVERDHDW